MRAVLLLSVALAVPAGAGSAGAAVLEPTAGAGSETRITIVASGDLLVHAPVAIAAAAGGGYDFRPLFARIRPLVRSADLALCHAETPIGAGARSGYPIFNAPRELARAIGWAGFDACSTASNHSVDRGAAGIASTIAALRRAGVEATGTARTRAGSRRILLLDAGGVEVAFLSYTYGTNGLPLPRPWSVNLIAPRRIVADARRARRQGAELVVVNLHWGAEYVHAPTADQRRWRGPCSAPGRWTRSSASTRTSCSRSAGSTRARSSTGRATSSRPRAPSAVTRRRRTG